MLFVLFLETVFFLEDKHPWEALIYPALSRGAANCEPSVRR
jgi:hypothetical protein